MVSEKEQEQNRGKKFWQEEEKKVGKYCLANPSESSANLNESANS